MTTETVQDVLRDMRERAGDVLHLKGYAKFADRIERALAESEPVGWTDAYELEEAKKGCGMGFFAGETTTTDIIPLYTRPAIGNKPAVDDAMVERAIIAGCATRTSEYPPNWPDGFNADEQKHCRSFMRAALTAAIIDSAQDGKGE